MKPFVLAAAWAAFLVSPASAEPISMLIVTTAFPSITGAAAAIASSVLTLGIGLGLSFIPNHGENR